MQKSLRILLVEDHLDTQRLMSRLLTGCRHDVKAADSVQSALSLAGANSFDLVISDIGLPDGSGVQLMQELHRRYGLRGIALSGYGHDDLGETERSGFVAHMTKPISLDKLNELIGQVAPH
jgi:CheY-like chemotaxis protein